MTKTTTKKVTTKKSSSTKNNKVSKTNVKSSKKSTKTPIKKVETKNVERKKLFKRVNPRIALIVIFLCAILLIFASYAWFSMNLNIKIKTLNMVVAKNSDLTISFDGINFERSIEINKDNIYNNLADVYPNHTTQWPSNGLIPVSSPGIPDSNSSNFDMFETNGVLYYKREKDRGFVKTRLSKQDTPREYNYYLAFDVFIKNDTGSPISDNLYFDDTTSIYAPGEIDEEMQGLINSFRVGIVKIGSVPLNASVSEIQNIKCNNSCTSSIYEPYSKFHTPLSIERAKKYGVMLVDGNKFPTYAYRKAGGPIYVENSISGSSKIDREYFIPQETITDDTLDTSIFQIPNGITKARVYVWIEGQDIDSLETNSKGTDVDISVNFVKDTAGWEVYNEK